MTDPVKVLVTDDAVVIRRLLSDVLAEDPDVQVVGTAANGHIALQKIDQLDPDVVILDVEMPEMDGLTTLREIRKVRPHLPVIMFSTLTERGAGATLDALTLGASDYVTKPANVGSVAVAISRVREELLPKVKILGGRNRPEPPPPSPRLLASTLTRLTPARAAPTAPVELVVIGVSTGGPSALAALIPCLPADFPVPVMVVQHMPPVFTRLLAERLDARSALAVTEARHGDAVVPGRVLIAPGDHHLIVSEGDRGPVAVLNQAPQENSCRPAVDPLFASAVECSGAGTLAVMLTGMGYDGLRGCRAVREAGGRVIAQDEVTSVVWGMPGAVVREELADEVVGIHEMAPTIHHLVTSSRAPLAERGVS